MSGNDVKELRDVVRIHLPGCQKSNVNIQSRRCFIVVPTRQVDISRNLVIALATNDQQELCVGLETAHSVNHETSRLLEALCFSQIVLFVEARFNLEQYGNVLTVLRCAKER